MPDVIEWSVFIFTVITIPLYCLMLSVIRDIASNEKRSSASFYLICEIVGYVDVFAITTAYVNRATVQRKREHRLLLMSLLVCSLQLIVTTYIIAKFAMGSAFDSELNLYNFLDTLYSAINPYLLFGFSDVLRQRMLRRALCCVRFLLRVHQRPLSPAAALSARTFPFNKKSATVT
ncbi:hypothetical protein M3Y98_00239200 [Aphelenchoides besseyi]|nr:hypothetical protein M3Y98_00239200 [Aphelenchoides besseyi]